MSNSRYYPQTMSQSNEEKPLYLSIRLSHLLRHCSVGAVVRTPDHLLTIRDIREWKDSRKLCSATKIPYVEQVKASLGIQEELREPPIAQLDNENNVQGSWLPAQIFPAWYVCQKCNLLHYKPWRNQPNAMHGNYLCEEIGNNKEFCNGNLEQVTLVQIHPEGHMADVPWRNIAHNFSGCDHADKPLHLKWNRKSNLVTCLHCNARGDINVGKHLPFIGYKQPWLNQHPLFIPTSNDNSTNNSEEKSSLAIIMEVNDTRVHQAHNKSALVIPPESRVERGSVVDKLYCNSHLRQQIYSGMSDFQRQSAISILAQQLGCDLQAVEFALAELDKGYPLYGKRFDSGQLLLSEYHALLDLIPDLKDDEDFVTHHKTQDWQQLTQSQSPSSLIYQLGQLVENVVSVAKLKEILVFMGFSRGGEGLQSKPDNDEEQAIVVDDNLTANLKNNLEPDLNNGLESSLDKPATTLTIVPPAIDEDVGWLPALELYGEGIFIALNQTYLSQWENHPEVQKRTNILIQRYVKMPMPVNEDITITPRFLLLHALSHLLIRELESQAGYPAASLKEKIYAAQDVNNPMAGILIYVAIPDVDGSLGGLAELAEPKRLAQLLVRVIEKAQWCSLDPVCSRHTGQGPGLLNLAACHACLLLPETSCCCGNILLDRKLVWGDTNIGLPSIFDIITGKANSNIESINLNNVFEYI